MKKFLKFCVISLLAFVALLLVLPFFIGRREAAPANSTTGDGSLRPVPVYLSYGKGVAHFYNPTSKILAVQIQFSREGSGQKVFDLTLNPQHEKNIGQADGWLISSGDVLEISADNYKTVHIIIR